MRAGAAPVPPSSCMSCCKGVSACRSTLQQSGKKGPTYLVLAVHGIASAAAANPAARAAHGTIVAPASAPLSVRAITRHVAGIAADTADDVGGVVLLLGAIVLAVPNLAAVLARLVLVVTEGSV